MPTEVNTELSDEQVAEIEARANAATKGPWDIFVCDDGGPWSGWPLSINSTVEEDRAIVRPGGFYPYEWDAKTSQHEANQTAEFIAHARRDIPALCATVKALRAQLAAEVERADSNFTAYDRIKGYYSKTVNRLSEVERERDDANKRAEETQASVEHLTSIIFANRHAHHMRSACIEAIRSLRHKSETDESRWNVALYHAEKRLESVTIQEQKP